MKQVYLIFLIVSFLSHSTFAGWGIFDGRGDKVEEPLVGWLDYEGGGGRTFSAVYPNPTKQQLIDHGFLTLLYNKKTGELCSGLVQKRTGAHGYLGYVNGVDYKNGDWIGAGIAYGPDGKPYIIPRNSFLAGQTANGTNGVGYAFDPDDQKAIINKFTEKTGQTIVPNPNATNHGMPIYDPAVKLAKNPQSCRCAPKGFKAPRGPRGPRGGGDGEEAAAIGALLGALWQAYNDNEAYYGNGYGHNFYTFWIEPWEETEILEEPNSTTLGNPTIDIPDRTWTVMPPDENYFRGSHVDPVW